MPQFRSHQPPFRLVYLSQTTCPPAGPTLCRFFSRGGRLSRIIFIALRGGSLK